MKTAEFFGNNYTQDKINELAAELFSEIKNFIIIHQNHPYGIKLLNHIENLMTNAKFNKKTIFTVSDINEIGLLLCSPQSKLFKNIATKESDIMRTNFNCKLVKLKEASMIMMDQELLPSVNKIHRYNREQELDRLRNLRSKERPPMRNVGIYEQAGLEDMRVNGPSHRVVKDILYELGSLIIQIDNYQASSSNKDPIDAADAKEAGIEFSLIYQKLQQEYKNIRDNHYSLDNVSNILKQITLDLKETAKFEHMQRYRHNNLLFSKIINTIKLLLLKIKILSEPKSRTQYSFLSKSIKKTNQLAKLSDKQSANSKKHIELTAKNNIPQKK